MKKLLIIASLLALCGCNGHKPYTADELAAMDAARFSPADTVKFWFPIHDQPEEELLQLFEEHTIDADPAVGQMDYFTFDPTLHGFPSDKKYPLIVVFHGAGNGMQGIRCIACTDMAIYAGKTYQNMLGGAYLLFPKANETPESQVTWLTKGADGHSIYSASVYAIIEEFLAHNENCDSGKIVIGGTSAGGFMTWDFLSQHHDMVAGAFLASPAGNPDQKDLARYRKQGLPLWVVHCTRDADVPFQYFTGPVADDLLRMKDVRLTVLDQVRFQDKRIATLPIPEGALKDRHLPGLEDVDASKAHDMGPHLTLYAFGANMLYNDGMPYDPRYPDGFIGWLREEVFGLKSLKLTPDNIDEVLAAMTLEEKASLLVGDAWGTRVPGSSTFVTEDTFNYESGPVRVPGAPFSTRPLKRFGIPGTGMADGTAGVRIDATRRGSDETFYATSFPSSTAMASSWNQDLAASLGVLVGEEVKEYGLDVVLGPGMDLQRNPLCGRNFEYYSEDPTLTGKMAAAWVRGVQSQGVGVSAKHFAANDVELNRLNSDSRMNPRTLREMSLKGFEIMVKESDPWTIMSSYNKINGVFTQQSYGLLENILRSEWGFKGIVMTDWGYKPGTVEAVKAGNDLFEAGLFFEADRIIAAVKDGSLPIEDVDRNVRRILEYIVKTPSYKGYAYSNNPDLEAHSAAVRSNAAEGFVLLSNKDSALPLENLGSVALFGCTSYDMVAGGTGSANVYMKHLWQLWEGFEENGIKADETLAAWYRDYVAAAREKSREADSKLILGKYVIADPMLDEDVIEGCAKRDDAAIITLGRNAGEGNDRRAIPGDWSLTSEELQLLQSVTRAFHAAGKKVVVVLNIGGAVETASWKEIPDAILVCWTPGQEVGRSVADVIIGKNYPSGKLPMTFPVDYFDIPSSANFPYDIIPEEPKYLEFGNMADMGPGVKNVGYINYEEGIWVGYRYFNTACKEVSYPFGYGLGYTSFEYSDLKVKALKDGSIRVRLKVSNTGSRAGKEAVQIYVKAPSGGLVKPEAELRAFGKTRELRPGESQLLEFTIEPYALASYNETSAAWETVQGEYTVKAAASVEDVRLVKNVTLKTGYSWPTHRVLLPQTQIQEIEVVNPR